MQRHTVYIFFFFFIFCRIGNAYGLLLPKDSIVFRDTLIESRSIHEARPLRIGIGGSYGINYYTDGNLPPQLTAACETFKTGKGSGLSFLGRIDFPLGNENDLFTFSPVLSYENFGADHTSSEFGTGSVIIDGKRIDHQAQFDHIIIDNTKAIGVKALLNWQFFKPLSFEVGPALYYLFNRQVTKTVKAITPGDVIIGPTGNVRELVEGSGSLPNANSILAALSFSIGAEFPLSQKLFATPNIEYLLPLTQTTSYWTHQSLRGGITFRYDLGKHEDTITSSHHEQIPIHIEIPDQIKPALSASIDVIAINRDGKEEHVVRMEVEEVKVHYAYPMLNYVFFDSGSVVIPGRYIRYPSFADAQRNFRGPVDRKGEGLLQLYRETLNILGDRLRKSPTTHITLTGCTSNTGSELGNMQIARDRAEAIESYLEKIWQIDRKRMKIESRILPEKPSPSNIPEGQAENRRVEITTSDESLTDPLIVTKTEHIANPPIISLQPHVSAKAGLKSYRSSIYIGRKELVTFNGSEQKPWSVPEEALSSGIDSLDIVLEVTDSADNIVIAHNSIKLEQKHIEREKQQELEKFSLILFAFDESKLGAKNERTLGLVAESFKKIMPQKLSIVGYTDELGEVDHNDELSRNRAAEASDQLGRALRIRGLKLPDNILIDGKGSREKLYDNSLPEGRFFSRTVNITVEHGK